MKVCVRLREDKFLLIDKEVLPHSVHQMEKPGEMHAKNEAIQAVQ